MLGNHTTVHFDTLKSGSTQIVMRVDHEYVPKVANHLARIKHGEGSPEATIAHIEIDRLLEEDNATGFIYENEDETAKIIVFPSVTRPVTMTFGPFNQEGKLDGILISVSGADKKVHIQLQNGEIKYTGIHTDRETARRLARHMYESVRVSGTGRWLRDQKGIWILKRFKVENYKVLATDNLNDIIDRMRLIEGSEWKNMDDPISVLKELRENGNGLH